MKLGSDNIHWLGHDSIRIDASLTIYIDPWEVSGPQADLILITHDHFDHCDPPTVKQLAGPDTLVVTDADSAAKLRETGLKSRVLTLAPGGRTEFKGARVQALPSYNLDKNFHPRAKGNLGFLLDIDGLSIYHAGDSDFIPEMKDIRVDVALLPVSGTYVMTADEAVEAALAIGPEVAIPMHYGKIVGDESMAERFAESLNGKVKVEIKALESV